MYRNRLITAGHICAHAADQSDTLSLLYVDTAGTAHTAGEFEPDEWIVDGVKDVCVLRRVGPEAPKGLVNLRRGYAYVGEAVSIVGAPWGHMTYRTDGYVASMDEYGGYIGVSAAAAPGNSGSPVVNSNGHVIGLLTAGMPAYEHVALVTPISIVDALIDD